MIYPLKKLSFRTMFDAVADAMLLTDDSGHIVLINPAAQQLFGYSAEELSGLAIEMLILPQYQKHYQELFANRPEKHSFSVGHELIALNRDGREMLLDISLSPIETQQQLYVLITFNAANRRLDAEEALRGSEERLRLDKQAAIDKAMDPASNGEFKAEYRVINSANGVERWISARGRVYFESGFAYRLIGVTRDITEQRILQKKLQAQRNETENIIKQQVAARTASAIAHELNQPLAAISAYCEVVLHALLSDAFNSGDLRRALEGCVEQAQRAGRSLHELLAFLQKGELITERLNLHDVINEALSIVYSDGYRRFHVVFHFEKSLPPVQCNRTQIQKVLINLFRNAIEAMDNMDASDIPTVTITTTLYALAETNMAKVIVQDNGPGLDYDMAERIFELFLQPSQQALAWGSI